MVSEEHREALKILGKRIRQVRLIHKLTQEQFGQILGKSASTIHGYESGKIIPPATGLFEISRLFHISVHELFGLINNCVANKQMLDEYFEVLLGEAGGEVE